MKYVILYPMFLNIKCGVKTMWDINKDQMHDWKREKYKQLSSVTTVDLKFFI